MCVREVEEVVVVFPERVGDGEEVRRVTQNLTVELKTVKYKKKYE